MKFQLSVLLIIILLFLNQESLYSQKIYLSPSGSETNPGTIERPLASLKAARDMSRVIRTGKQSTDLCRRLFIGGAITLFRVETKCQIRMGLAEIKTKNCLLATLKECDRCKAACPYNAVEMGSADNSNLMLPFISKEKCTGCGACMVICPTACISIKTVTI